MLSRHLPSTRRLNLTTTNQPPCASANQPPCASVTGGGGWTQLPWRRAGHRLHQQGGQLRVFRAQPAEVPHWLPGRRGRLPAGGRAPAQEAGSDPRVRPAARRTARTVRRRILARLSRAHYSAAPGSAVTRPVSDVTSATGDVTSYLAAAGRRIWGRCDVTSYLTAAGRRVWGRCDVTSSLTAAGRRVWGRRDVSDWWRQQGAEKVKEGRGRERKTLRTTWNIRLCGGSQCHGQECSLFSCYVLRSEYIYIGIDC